MDTRNSQRELEIQFLEDPLVHDDDGDIEGPPLYNREERSEHAPLKQHAVLHHHRAPPNLLPSLEPGKKKEEEEKNLIEFLLSAPSIDQKGTGERERKGE